MDILIEKSRRIVNGKMYYLLECKQTYNVNECELPCELQGFKKVVIVKKGRFYIVNENTCLQFDKNVRIMQKVQAYLYAKKQVDYFLDRPARMSEYWASNR